MYEGRSSFSDISGEFIVAGDDAFDYRCWDSYYIVRGLLVSGLTDTVKKMILTFSSFIERLTSFLVHLLRTQDFD